LNVSAGCGERLALEKITENRGLTSLSMATEPVRAAGAIVWRVKGENENPQVLVVHRPRYNDWSFPKGKLELGETDLACALREVEEETGLQVVVGAELPTVEYRDHKDREKTVAYWAMTVLGSCDDEAFVSNDEVDEMQWMPTEEARALLTYPIDQLLLDEFSSLTDLARASTEGST
jgi:8-oxo-dGTP pyrophosphatase MutT (NUDIX family)